MDDEERRTRKLFIGGVSFSTSDEDFFKYFAKFGELEDCVLIREKDTGQSRGFGFVTYKDKTVSDHVAVQQLYLDGRRLDPKPSISRYNMDQIHGEHLSYKHRNQTTKVFVGGLHDDTAEAELSEHFTGFGEVLEVNIMYDRFTNAPRGFGFVTFKEPDVARKVITYEQDHIIHNKKVDCKPATARKDAFKREPKTEQKATSREERWRKYHGDNDEVGPALVAPHDAAAASAHHHSSYAAHYGTHPAHSSYAHSSAAYPHDAVPPHYPPPPSSYAYPHAPPPAHYGAPPPHHVHPPPHYPHYDPYYRPPPHSSYPPAAAATAKANEKSSAKNDTKSAPPAAVPPPRYEAYPPQYPPPQYGAYGPPRYDYYAQYHQSAAASGATNTAKVDQNTSNTQTTVAAPVAKVDQKTIPSAYGASRGSKATNSAQTKRYSAY